MEEKMKNPGLGDNVFWFDSYGNLNKGEIYKIEPMNRAGEQFDYALIQYGANNRIKSGARLDDCYLTEKECIKAENRRTEALRAEYEAAMPDVESLMHFMYESPMNGEIPDYNMKAAAGKRAEELLGVDVIGNSGIRSFDSIDTVEELAQFMYDTDFRSEDSMQEDRDKAVAAAKNILNIDLNAGMEDDFAAAVTAISQQDEGLKQ